MSDTVARRRSTFEKKINAPLIFQLVLVLNSRKEIMYLCTKSSLAMRVASLCEMALRKELEISNNRVVVAKGSENTLYKEISDKISQSACEPMELIKVLNGERSSSKSIKDYRKKVYKEMESKGLIKTKTYNLFKKIKVMQNDLYHEVNEKILYEVRHNSISIETEVLLSCLWYIDSLECLRIQYNSQTEDQLLVMVEKIRQKVKSRSYPPEDYLIQEFLLVLFK